MTWIEMEPYKRLTRPKDDESKQRIVQTAPGTKTETAAPDAYLGAQNQTVDRETVSRKHEVTVGASQKTPPRTATEQRKRAAADAITKPGTLSKFGLPILPEARTRGMDQERKPDAPVWAKSDGMAQDYVKGIKESETTALNTREYVFYGYFQRIRQRLDLAWNSTLRTNLSKLWRTGRRLASDIDHTTRVLVTLNAGGEIVRVQILEESGTHDLDDAAVRAFNDAGPFPNPPKGMTDAQGYIQIRWDFVLRT